MDFDKLINELFNSLNEVVNRSDLAASITKPLNELFETLEIIKNCTSCKKDDNIRKKRYFDKFLKSKDEIEKQVKGGATFIDDYELKYMDDMLNRKALCNCCKEKR